jgi:protein-arginine kinase activator protein McsA
MQGSQLFPPDGSHRKAEQECPECGQTFEPLLMDDGSEELCETCYQAQFQPLHVAKWQRLVKQPRSARLQSASHVARRSRPASAA